MIRQLNSNELSLTRELAEGFFIESQLPGKLDFYYWEKQWENFIKCNLGYIIGSFTEIGILNGMIGGLIYRCPMTTQLEALEAFWYCKPEARGTSIGIRLIQAFEQEAKLRQAVRVKMSHLAVLNAETMRDIYLRMGYTPQETTYYKNL